MLNICRQFFDPNHRGGEGMERRREGVEEIYSIARCVILNEIALRYYCCLLYLRFFSFFQFLPFFSAIFLKMQMVNLQTRELFYPKK